ncbi:hypothetical protein Tco_1570262 [Tanacetum coccineum]
MEIRCSHSHIIPAEIGMPTLRTAKIDMVQNDEALEINLDLLEERRENNDASHVKDSGKLSPKWEGPYEVMKALGNGEYKLMDHNGKLFLRTWNVRNLKKCYVHEM